MRDFPLQLLFEKVPHTAQISETLLADRADEDDGTLGGDFPLVERADDGQQHREPAAIVGDARRLEDGAAALDLGVGARGEHRVEMRGKDDQRSRPPPRPHAVHIALGVDTDVLQAKFDKFLPVVFRANFLFDRRRRNLAEPHLLIERLGLHALEEGQGVANRRPAGERRALGPKARRHGREGEKEAKAHIFRQEGN